MKKILLPLSILTLLLLAASSTFAQNISSSTAEMNLHEEIMQEKIASTTLDIQNKKAEINAEIEKRIGKNLDPQRTAIAQQFENVLNQLNNLVTKIQSRISKMQTSGIDTTAISASLAITQSNIATAENDVTALENGLAEPIASSTRNETIAALEIQSNTTKSDIESAYTSLTATIHLLASATSTQE